MLTRGENVSRDLCILFLKLTLKQILMKVLEINLRRKKKERKNSMKKSFVSKW
jgi:hypothetical protein